jgi:large subunit ribosomal protein L6
MSRIGKTPVRIPNGVSADMSGHAVVVRGPRGELAVGIPHGIEINRDGEHMTVSVRGGGSKVRALHGLVRAELANAVKGVTDGWDKTLEMVGVGYRATIQGENLVLSVGFSHPVEVVPPAGIAFTVKEGKIVVSGIDKRKIGQIAADIRAVKKPEPYKGKGIRYEGEYIRRKAGKAKAVGGAPGK